MKYVLTGGPNSGKTSVINILRERGFNVVNEIARYIIGDLPHKPQNELDFIEMERMIFTRQLIEEVKSNSKPGIKFFDRGLPDVIAYFLANSMSVPKDFVNRDVLSGRYSGIFILESSRKMGPILTLSGEASSLLKEFKSERFNGMDIKFDFSLKEYGDLNKCLFEIKMVSISSTANGLKSSISFSSSLFNCPQFRQI